MIRIFAMLSLLAVSVVTVKEPTPPSDDIMTTSGVCPGFNCSAPCNGNPICISLHAYCC